MAFARMIHQAVICSDEYLNLSYEAQALYPQLTVMADNFGILNGTRRIIRQAGVGQEAMQELLDAGFLLDLGDGTYALTHWLIANGSFRDDKHMTTQFPKQLEMLCVDEAECYYLQGYPVWGPNGAHVGRQLNVTQRNAYQHIAKALFRNSSVPNVSPSFPNTNTSSSGGVGGKNRTDEPEVVFDDEQEHQRNIDAPIEEQGQEVFYIDYDSPDQKKYSLREWIVQKCNWPITEATWQLIEEYRPKVPDDKIANAVITTLRGRPTDRMQTLQTILNKFTQDPNIERSNTP